MVYVERAPSGRARCEWCGQPIHKGSWRVGIPDFYYSRIFYHWYHPECFLKEDRGGDRRGLIRDFLRVFLPLFFDEETVKPLIIALELKP